MATIRGLVKKELIKRGYPVEISEWYKGKITYRKYVKQEGIELKRSYYKTYTDHRIDMTEDLIVRCNGYIKKEEVKEIIEEILKEYKPYKTTVNYYIYEK